MTAAALPARHQMLTTLGRVHSADLLSLAMERTRLAYGDSGVVVTGV
jgi:hypothetical protein